MKVQTILEKLLFSTIKIETIYANGTGSGTGFFFNYIYDNQTFPFIVTNKHVIENSIGAYLTFIEEKAGAPVIGNGFTLGIGQEWWEKCWFGHSDPDIDIAVIPLNPLLEDTISRHEISPFCQFVTSALIPSQAQLDSLSVLETITFLGYPNGLWDPKSLIPVMRRGTTATPLMLDFEGKPKFLIDASVFGGSSGSPVFITDQGMYTTRTGSTRVGSRIYFIGVIAGVYYRTDKNEVIPGPLPMLNGAVVEFNQMIDLGIVFKAHTVEETIMQFIKLNYVPD